MLICKTIKFNSMTKFKIILISVLSVYFMNITNAQNNNRQRTQTTKTNVKVAPTNGEILTCEVNNSRQVASDLNNKVLKNEVKNKTVQIVIDPETQSVSLSFDSTKVAFTDIEEKLQAKGYMLTRKKKEMVEEKVLPPAEKYKPEIDKFLNCEDVSIFSEKFMVLKDIEIHPRSQGYYQLIKNIRYLDILLKKNDLSSIRSDLDEMGKLIDIINDPAQSPKNLLPKPLLDYYKGLVNKYVKIYDQIYE